MISGRKIQGLSALFSCSLCRQIKVEEVSQEDDEIGEVSKKKKKTDFSREEICCLGLPSEMLSGDRSGSMQGKSQMRARWGPGEGPFLLTDTPIKWQVPKCKSNWGHLGAGSDPTRVSSRDHWAGHVKSGYT